MVFLFSHAASTYADDWGEWDEGDTGPLGDKSWWEGGDWPPKFGGPKGKLPPWLWFFIHGRQGLDGRDGRKGHMGDKGDCGDKGIKGAKGMPGTMGGVGDPGEAGANVRKKNTCMNLSITFHSIETRLCRGLATPGHAWRHVVRLRLRACGTTTLYIVTVCQVAVSWSKDSLVLQGMPGMRGNKGMRGATGPPGIDATGAGGSPAITRVYTRWGQDSCPAGTGASLVYFGRAGTSYHNNAGAGANIVCLNDDFSFTGVFQSVDDSQSTTFGSINGVEYHTSMGDPLESVANENVPCAVCSVQANAVYMQPGRTMCPPNWSIQYVGYIMSELEDRITDRESENYRSHYVCVDDGGGVIADLDQANIEARLTHVHADCPPGTDILTCPGVYDRGQISCVVCSKNSV